MEKVSYRIIELPKHFDPRGSLTVSEEIVNVPFNIASSEWLYGITIGTCLLKHAYTNTKIFIVPLSGSFTVRISDGYGNAELFLNHPNKALFIDQGIWTEITDCSNGTVILVLSNKREQERAKISQWEEYRAWMSKRM